MGSGRQEGFLIPGNNSRRNADMLIAQQFRRYYSYEPGLHGYHEGVAFYANGQRIENFPKQHSEKCTAKHKATNNNFKRMVRVFKNMRNAMIEKGLLAEGVAPRTSSKGCSTTSRTKSSRGTTAIYGSSASNG